jgi:hypothetical protein
MAFAEDSDIDIVISRDRFPYHIGGNPPRVGSHPHTAAIC